MKKFNQARVNGGSNYDSLKADLSGSGFGRAKMQITTICHPLAHREKLRGVLLSLRSRLCEKTLGYHRQMPYFCVDEENRDPVSIVCFLFTER